MAIRIPQKYIRLVAIGAVAVAGVANILRPSPMQVDPDLRPLAQQAGFLQSPQPAPAMPAEAEGGSEADPATEDSAPEDPPEPLVARGTASPAAEPVALPPEPGAELVFSVPAREVRPVLPPEPAPVTSAVAEAVETNECAVSVETIPVPGGFVYFIVEAPCAPPGPAQISHAGLSVTLEMPASGRLAASVPLLDRDQPFRATFTDGTFAEGQVEATSARAFEHVVLQWEGETGLQLHALEDGAAYGSSGHVWAGAPRGVLSGVRGEGGFLTRLGSSELGGVAEIYSFPAGAMGGESALSMTVEAEVDETNCGRDISGELLQRGLDGQVTSARLMFAVPGCDAIGDILVLKNILRDLKFAAN